MAWEVEITDDCKDWYEALPEDLQEAIKAKEEMLVQQGPYLGRPHCDTLAKMSKLSNLKELRVVHRGDAYRILFCFDPRRVAILLWGGRKPDERWYKKAIPKAERLYEIYLDELRGEGKLW